MLHNNSGHLSALQESSKRNRFEFIILGYLIMFFHNLFILVKLYIAFTTTNVYLLLAIIIINILILIQWVLLDGCVTHRIENMLLKYNHTILENGQEKSESVRFFGKYFGEKNVYVFFSLVPVIESLYASFKILQKFRKMNIPFSLQI